MSALEVEFCGLKFSNPFLLSSAPPTTDGAMIKRAFEAGWAGAVTKTLVLEKVPMKNVSPRLTSLAFPTFEEQKKQLIQKDINLSKNEKKMKEYMRKMPDMSFSKLESMHGKQAKSNCQGQSEEYLIDSDREIKRNIAHYKDRSREINEDIKRLSEITHKSNHEVKSMLGKQSESSNNMKSRNNVQNIRTDPIPKQNTSPMETHQSLEKAVHVP